MVKKRFGNPAATFSERVVRIALCIPKGSVTTYGRISRAAGGGDMAAQSITSILGKAYDRGVKDIPFHRIVYANGRVWIDEVHREERMKKYKEEGIEVDARGYIKDFEHKLIEDLKPMLKK